MFILFSGDTCVFGKKNIWNVLNEQALGIQETVQGIMFIW